MTDTEPLAAGDYDAPLWLQALTYPAQTDRDLIDAVYNHGGVLGQGELLVAPRAAGGNMSVDVAPGRVVVTGSDIAGQGKYLGRMRNTVNVPLTAAPGAGLTRIDLVYAHVTDATVVGGTVNNLTVETPIAGTPASSNPVVPTLPPSSEALAQIVVASGTAAITAGMITDRRRLAATGVGADTLHAKMLRGAAYQVTGSYAPFLFDGTVRDPAGMWNAGQIGFVVPVSGIYLVGFSFILNPTSSPTVGQFAAGRVTVGGASVASMGVHQSMGFGFGPLISTAAYVAAGQTVQMQATCTPANLNGITGVDAAFGTIDYLGTG
jgi:hypothetical protein